MAIMNFEDSARAQAQNNELAARKKAEIAQRAGGVAEFCANLGVEPVVSDAEHATLAARQAEKGGARYRGRGPDPILTSIRSKLQAWFPVYEQCFPIPGERESFKGFTDIVTKGNFDPAMQAKVGPFREQLVSLRDPQDGKVIGGLNFASYLHADSAPTIHSTYAFLAASYRGLGLARKMFDIRDQAALDFFASMDAGRASLRKHRGFYGMSEQNIPEVMDGLSYVKDSSQAVDQVTRLKIWSKLAYSTINPKDFHYVQPKLTDDGQEYDGLSLNTYFRAVIEQLDGTFKLGDLSRPTTTPTRALYNHIRAFFSQSVRKDVNADVNDSTTIKALAWLKGKMDRKEPIRTIPLDERMDYLATWGSRIAEIVKRYGAVRLNSVATIETMWAKLQTEPRVVAKAARRTERLRHSKPSPQLVA